VLRLALSKSIWMFFHERTLSRSARRLPLKSRPRRRRKMLAKRDFVSKLFKRLRICDSPMSKRIAKPSALRLSVTASVRRNSRSRSQNSTLVTRLSTSIWRILTTLIATDCVL
jgi:hypothetical protein